MKVKLLQQLILKFVLLFFVPNGTLIGYLIYDRDGLLDGSFFYDVLIMEVFLVLFMGYITLEIEEVDPLRKSFIWFTVQEMRYVILAFLFQVLSIVSVGILFMFFGVYKLEVMIVGFSITINFIMALRVVSITRINFFNKQQLMYERGIIARFIDPWMDKYVYVLLPYIGGVIIGANCVLVVLGISSVNILVISVGWFFLVLMCLGLRMCELKFLLKDNDLKFKSLTIKFIKNSVMRFFGIFVFVMVGFFYDVVLVKREPIIISELKSILLVYLGFICLCLIFKLKRDEEVIKEYFKGSIITMLDVKSWLKPKNVLIGLVIFILCIFILGVVFYFFSMYVIFRSHMQATLEWADIQVKDNVGKVIGCLGCQNSITGLDEVNRDVFFEQLKEMELVIAKNCKVGDLVFKSTDQDIVGWYQVELIITEEEYKLFKQKDSEYISFNLDNGRVALLKRYHEVHKLSKIKK